MFYENLKRWCFAPGFSCQARALILGIQSMLAHINPILARLPELHRWPEKGRFALPVINHKNLSKPVRNSDQQLVIFPANRNRNRFAEPTSVRIEIGIVCEFQNLQIGIGIIFVRWEVFANYSQIPEIFFFSIFFSKNILFLTPIYL